jgi:hypothetical protein
MLFLHPGVARVEHPHPVAMPAQDRRQRLNAQGRESHHLNPPISRPGSVQPFRKQLAKVLVSNINQEDVHGKILWLKGQLENRKLHDPET